MQPDESRTSTTHIFQLLRSPVEPAIGQLPLAQPPAERVAINEIEPAEDRQCADAGPDCAHVS